MSKPKNKRPIRNRFIPRLGHLEDRVVPAGNVAALVGDGILYVVGDNLANKIWIAGAGGNRVTIQSTDGSTLINGQTGPITFDGVNGGFHVVMNDGDDAVALTGVNAYRNLNVDMGAGGDGFMTFAVVSWRDTNIFTGAGNDAITLAGSTFLKNMVVDSGDGNDLVGMTSSYFGRDTFINAGTGGNLFDGTNSFFARAPITAGFNNGITPEPPIQNPPIANNDSATVARGGTVSINVAANDVAQTGSLNLSSIVITRNPTFGTVSVTGNGSVSYTSNNTATSTIDSFQYTIRDTNGVVSNAATVSITIQDTSNPTVTVSSTSPNPTGTSPIVFDINFSEDVAMLTESDITVTGGVVGLLTRLSARSYRAEIDVTTDGTVSVSLAAGVVNDLSGNPNLASNTVSIVFDTTNPSITINPLTTNDPTPTITGTVEAGSTVSVTVNGQTVAATVTGTTWSATLTTALADGTYTIMATATDTGGDTGTATLADGLIINTVAPTVAITTTATDPTNLAVIPFTVTFSEAVMGFTADGLTIVNGTVSNFVADANGTTFTFDVTPTADGLVTVTVEAAAASDAAGNTNAETSFSITFEGAAPTPVITSTATSPTNLATIPFTVTFNETVTGFDATDVVVGNGTLSNFVADANGTTFTFDVTPTADGDVTIDIAAGAAQDGSGNDSVAASFTIVSDRTAPTVTVTTTATDPTNLASIPYTVTFSETVTGFTAAGLTVVNGTVSNFVADANGTTFTFDVAPTANGLVTVTVNANAGQDAAGNGNAETSASITVAGLVPAPTITTTATNPTNLATIPFTVTFNIAVTDFDDSDILVGNGTLTNFIAVDTRTFTFDVTPAADGAVTIDIAAGAALADDGTPSIAATFSITSDRTTPAAPAITGLTPFNAGFSNSSTPTIIGMAEAGTTIEVFADNGTGPVSIGTTTTDAGGNWTFTPATELADGAYGLTAIASDGANFSPESSVFAITIDTTAPTATVTTTATSPTNLSSIPFTVTFSEDVFGFTADGVLLINAGLSDFMAVNPRTYTFNVIPGIDGLVTVGVQGGAADDAAGNNNISTLGFTILSERSAPSVAITTLVSNPTSLNPIPFFAIFSESVIGFELGDIVVTNGTPSNLSTQDGRTYTFDVTPTANGTVTIDIAAGVAQDSAGNDNTAAPSFSIVSDTTAPAAPVITGIDPSDDFGLQGDGRTNVPDPTIIGTAEAGTTVRLFADSGAGPVLIATVTATAGGTWSAAPSSPLADGTYTLTATATNTLGSVSPTSASFVLVIDTIDPVPTFATLAPNPTNVATISMTLTFTEDTFNVSLGELMITNGAVANLSALNARTFLFDLTPAGDGTVTITLPAGAGNDLAGNPNTAGFFSIVSDRTAPTGAINANGVQVISGTAGDATSGVAGVRISIFNGSFYWDGTGFNSTQEMFFDTDSDDNFATWRFAFTATGNFTVNAQIRDAAGNTFGVTSQVTVT